jgi:phosphatidylserine/phosphatidylglycerophosphate/cardiolipin synthase-like enzyme
VTKIDLHDRMISPRALGHNKFLVICDDQKRPRWVWTGSQNWTKTGLCTQANNSVLIDDADLAHEYRVQWDLLQGAEDETPQDLKDSNSKPRDHRVGQAGVRLWSLRRRSGRYLAKRLFEGGQRRVEGDRFLGRRLRPVTRTKLASQQALCILSTISM